MHIRRQQVPYGLSIEQLCKLHCKHCSDETYHHAWRCIAVASKSYLNVLQETALDMACNMPDCWCWSLWNESTGQMITLWNKCFLLKVSLEPCAICAAVLIDCTVNKNSSLFFMMLDDTKFSTKIDLTYGNEVQFLSLTIADQLSSEYWTICDKRTDYLMKKIHAVDQENGYLRSVYSFCFSFVSVPANRLQKGMKIMTRRFMPISPNAATPHFLRQTYMV